MQLSIRLLLALLSAIAPRAARAEPAVTVPLHLHADGTAEKAAADTLQRLAVELLESSSLDTVSHPDVLKQSIPAIRDRHRRVVAGECLVIAYPSPVKIQTLGGEVPVFEIVIGLNRPDYVDALFTIDDGGRVVAHEKYSGSLAVELRKAADAAVGAQ